MKNDCPDQFMPEMVSEAAGPVSRTDTRDRLRDIAIAGCPVVREGHDGFDIKSISHIEAFIQFLDKKVPALVERCGQVRELDRMVNSDRTRIDGINFLSAEGPIVLAWLAGNPNFDSMVAYADSRYDRSYVEGDTPIVRLADHLRRNVPVD